MIISSSRATPTATWPSSVSRPKASWIPHSALAALSRKASLPPRLRSPLIAKATSLSPALPQTAICSLPASLRPALDTTFGSSGGVFNGQGYADDFPYSPYQIAHSVLIQSNGQIVAVGENSDQVNVVVRYNSNGTPDKTF